MGTMENDEGRRTNDKRNPNYKNRKKTGRPRSYSLQHFEFLVLSLFRHSSFDIRHYFHSCFTGTASCFRTPPVSRSLASAAAAASLSAVFLLLPWPRASSTPP